ncbi:MAG: tRNA(Ile)-lysidine synthase [Candidatus Endobugula sp.]
MSDHSILAHITEKMSPLPKSVKRWVVAYSGGIDSTVLLHALAECNRRSAQPLVVVALHINHQLSVDAADWQQHCEQVATTLGVEFFTKSVAVQLAGKGAEAAAREARYAVFENFLQEDDALLFGHHQQDQAETLLLRLFRGAGVRGLMAMPESRAIGRGNLLRPLLTVTKADIQSYAQQHQLQWVDDESNAQDDYDRNYLRNRIVPLLRTRWPALDAQLLKTSARMQQANTLLNEVAAEDLLALDAQAARVGFSVDFKKLNQLSHVRKMNFLRYWCESVAYPLPDADQLAQIEQQFFSRSALLSSACVSWANRELRQFAGRLYLMPALSKFTAAELIVEWDCLESLPLGDAGLLQLVNTAETNSGLVLKQQAYQIRWRQGGERSTPSQRQHSQTVKKLLQEYGLETWLRDRVPLIYCGDDLVAVGDLWVNKGYETEDTEASVLFRWGCV